MVAWLDYFALYFRVLGIFLIENGTESDLSNHLLFMLVHLFVGKKSEYEMTTCCQRLRLAI